MSEGWRTHVWRRGPARPLAPMDEVHVWRADLDASPAAALGLLCSEDERVRAADIDDRSGRARYLARRGLHQLLLGGYAVGNGRMELHTVSAHLGADALFAVGRSAGLGLSLVRIPRPGARVERLPGLNNRERLGIHRLPGPQRARVTSAVLAAKEAVGSARGRGLDGTMEELELLPAVGPVAGGGAFHAELEGISWAGAVLRIGDDRVACVAHDGGPRTLRAWTLGG